MVGDGDVCEKPVKEVKSLTFTPELQDAESADLTQKFAEYVTKAAQFSRACEEALTEMLVTGIAGTIIMGFLWVLFLWLFAGVIVFVALTVLVVTLLIITVICYVRAGWTPNPDDYFNSTDITPDLGEYNYENLATTDNRTAYAVMAVIMTILLAIVLIMLAMWRKCIVRCVAIIRESTKVFKTIPSMMIWPLVSIVFLTATYFWAFLVAAYIFYVDEDTYAENLDKLQKAIEEYSSGDAASHLDSDPSTQKWVLFWVHIFGVLWVVEFIRACTWITMSGAVCYWFFFHGRDDAADKQERFPLLSSCKRVLRYHLGSAAFGALIIAICQLIRYMLATLDYYTKDAQDKNLIFKLAIKCSQCAMWCLQKTIEFVSYFGFVYIALNGTSFCASCKETFKFLLTPKNAMQTAVNKVVEKLIILIIAWTTPTFMSLICYAWLSGNDEYTADNNPLYPCIIVWVGSFALAGAIATVFECTIDTIFLCSFRDAAKFDGKYMSKDMKAAFDIKEEEMGKMGISAVQTSADYKEHHELAEKKQAEGAEPTIHT